MRVLLRKKILILLLVGFALNIAHPYFFHHTDENVAHYIQEIEYQHSCDDICTLHHFFHLNFLLSTNAIVLEVLPKRSKIEIPLSICYQYFSSSIFKPPRR